MLERRLPVSLLTVRILDALARTYVRWPRHSTAGPRLHLTRRFRARCHPIECQADGLI